MKAYHILMFMFLFNLFFWTITVGIGMYNVGISGQQEYGQLMTSDPVNTGFAIFAVFGLWGDGYASIAALTGVLVVASMLGYFSAGTAPQGIIYGLFSWFFWSSYLNTITIFYSISNYAGEVLWIIVIFSLIVGAVFITGLAQMVTGGWKAHE